MNKLESVHSDLRAVFEHAFAAWVTQHPAAPVPRVSQGARTEAEQTAFYAQGRQPLPEINRLRKLAAMVPIGAKEAKLVVTHARWGQGPHCFFPARALDVAFVNAAGKLDWRAGLFAQFNGLMEAAAADLHVAVTWGGFWPQGKKDLPHWELTHWKAA